MRRSIVYATTAVFLAGAYAVPAQAKTLVYCSEASPEAFNPQLGLANTTYDANGQIYNRLVELERGTSEIIPALAESWEVSDDGLTYTFHLRRGVAWHTRPYFTPTREFNADDVVHTFERQMDENHPYHGVGGGTYEYFAGMGLAESIKDVRKVDSHTVEVTLNAPDAAFLAALTPEPMSILSAEYADTMLEAGTPDRVDTNPIGTGPFQFVNYQKDAVIRYEAFPDYWAEAAGMEDRVAKVESLVFAITPDASVRWQKLQAGECHVMRYPNPADIAAMRADPAIVVYDVPSMDYAYLAFNAQKEPFGDARVRRALSLAISRDALLDAVYLGVTGTPATAVVPPGLWGHNDQIEPYPHDPERAKELLSEAGYADGFKADLWAMPVQRPYMPNARRAAELIQSDLAKIGVETEIVSYEWGEYLQRTREGEHDITLLGWIYDYADPGQLLVLGWTCQAAEVGANRARWCNEEFDELVSEAQRITDREERAELYRKAQEIFHEEAPAYLIAHSVSFAPVRQEVAGYKVHPFGGQPFYGVSLTD